MQMAVVALVSQIIIDLRRQGRDQARRVPHGWLAQWRQIVMLGKAAALEPILMGAADTRKPRRAQTEPVILRQGAGATAPACQRCQRGKQRRVSTRNPLARAVHFMRGELVVTEVEIIVHVRSCSLAELHLDVWQRTIRVVRRIPNMLKSINKNFFRLDAAQMNRGMQVD